MNHQLAFIICYLLYEYSSRSFSLPLPPVHPPPHPPEQNIDVAPRVQVLVPQSVEMNWKST